MRDAKYAFGASLVFFISSAGVWACSSSSGSGDSTRDAGSDTGADTGTNPHDSSTPDAKNDDAGDAGETDSGQTDAQTCTPLGSVTFTLHASPDAGDLNVGQTQDTDSPQDEWITLFTADGGAEIDMLPNGTNDHPSCTDCAGPGVGIPIGLAWGTLGDAGIQQTWDGTIYPVSTCGPKATACVQQTCAQAGHYQARMCACPGANLSSGSCSSAVCKSIDFDYPGQTSIEGTLP